MKPSASSLSLPSVAASRIPAGGSRRLESAAWFARWRLGHSRLLTATFATLAVAFALGLEIAVGTQLALLAAAVALFGLPHGALDHIDARPLLRPRLGRWWLPAFAAAYLVPAGVAIAAWIFAPRAMLLVFLLYSVWHFGSEDSLAAPTKSYAGLAAAVLRGLAPIAVPAFFHSAEVSHAFNWLLPTSAAVDSATVKWSAGIVLAIAVAALTVIWRVKGSEPSSVSAPEWWEIGALVALFALAPPLIAFLFYFCGLHSPRQLARVGRKLAPNSGADAVSRLLREALPLTAATVVLGLVAWVGLAGSGIQADAALARVVFMGLSALTVPHMLFDSIAAGRS